MKVSTGVLALALLGVSAGSLAAQEPTGREPTGREVMEAYKAQDRTDDLSAEQTMTLLRARGERKRELTYVTRTDADGDRKMLIRFLAPPEIEGTGFLSVEHADRDDDRWLYLPATRKTRRIAGSDKTDDFVGSQFTYEDLDSERLDLYEYRLVGSDTVDRVETWVVEAVPSDPKKIEETGYDRRELWIEKDHDLVVRARFYDRDGSYVKELRASEIRQVPGSDRWRPYRLTMEDVRDGDRTVIDVHEYRIDTGVPDSFFSERYLKRGR